MLIGTAHDFQGDERDAMFISFTIDGDASRGTLRYLNRPDVFNVAVTRARSVQYVFCSARPECFPRDSLICRYLESIEDDTAASRPGGGETTSPFEEDVFIGEVREALVEQGFETWVGWPVAGLNVDLVVQKNERYVAIDLPRTC